MKKYFVAAMLLLGTLTMSAAEYTHSVGINVGTLYGVSYKGFIFGVDGLALQADLGVNLQTTAGGGKSVAGAWDTKFNMKDASMFSFQANPQVIYQQPIQSWDACSLDWYVGGGITFGLSQLMGDFKIKAEGEDEWATGSINEKDANWLKMGVHATAGLELAFKGAPLALSLDFRPGYAYNYHKEKADNPTQGNGEDIKDHLNTFDWQLAIGLRYLF